MLKEFAWSAFEKTGNIDAYVFYREIQERNSQISETKAAEQEVAISS